MSDDHGLALGARGRRAPRPSRRAFTLVELLVAMAVGAGVMVAAAAIARMSFGAVTIANGIAQENALLRGGIALALNELDWWRSYDDPNDAARQRLRRSIQRPDGFEANVPVTLGMPFTPLSAAWPANAAETADLDPNHWSSADRRSRWRGNLMERVSGDLREGRYALFSNGHRNPTLGSPATGPFGAVSVPGGRTWLASQTRGLNRALGYAGMFDYLPCSSVYAWYGEYLAPPAQVGPGADAPYPWTPGGSAQMPEVPSGTTDGGIDLEFVQEMRGGAGNERARNPFFCMLSDWNDNNFLSLDGVAFPVVPPDNAVTATFSDEQMVHYHRWWFTQLNVFASASASYAPTSLLTKPLLPMAPSAWPGVTVSVQRAYAWGDVAVCGVRSASPVNGHVTELTFGAFGTTLRGARQQRGLDAP